MLPVASQSPTCDRLTHISGLTVLRSCGATYMSLACRRRSWKLLATCMEHRDAYSALTSVWWLALSRQEDFAENLTGSTNI